MRLLLHFAQWPSQDETLRMDETRDDSIWPIQGQDILSPEPNGRE